MSLTKCKRCGREFASGFHDCVDLCDDCTAPAFEQGRRAERAAVVAWLRPKDEHDYPGREALGIADGIEAGRHINAAQSDGENSK